MDIKLFKKQYSKTPKQFIAYYYLLLAEQRRLDKTSLCCLTPYKQHETLNRLSKLKSEIESVVCALKEHLLLYPCFSCEKLFDSLIRGYVCIKCNERLEDESVKRIESEKAHKHYMEVRAGLKKCGIPYDILDNNDKLIYIKAIEIKTKRELKTINQ